MTGPDDAAIVYAVARIQHWLDLMAVVSGIWLGLILLWLVALMAHRAGRRG